MHEQIRHLQRHNGQGVFCKKKQKFQDKIMIFTKIIIFDIMTNKNFLRLNYRITFLTATNIRQYHHPLVKLHPSVSLLSTFHSIYYKPYQHWYLLKKYDAESITHLT